MAKNKSNQSWLHDHINDPYVKLAQKHGYRARAAYKLKEIDEHDKLIRPGQIIVDLGAAPGSWSQYAREKLGSARKEGAERVRGRIIAVDLVPIDPIDGVVFIQGDFRDDEVAAQLEQCLAAEIAASVDGRCVDLVLSDMAPNLSGVELADAARMQHVTELALEFAQKHLKPSGALLVKAFHGSGYSQIVEAFKRRFVTVAARKPNASRARSAETFILARGLKKPGAGKA